MSATLSTREISRISRRIAHLGGRTITAMVAALVAAILLFASPEIGIAGAVGGVIVGGISAVLIRPHHN